VDRPVRVKGAEGEGEAHHVRHVARAIARSALHRDIADIATLADRRGIERGGLAGRPGQNEVAMRDGASAPQCVQAPGLAAHDDDMRQGAMPLGNAPR